MVSVAMATYNSEKYIIKQLESINNQTNAVDEVIIQDDCSTDNTIEIIQNYIQTNNLTNWKIEKNIQNLGYILTFKCAIKRCKGDIIVLCDHDDIWLDKKIEIMLNSFKQNTNILVLATSFIQIDENDQEIKIRNKKQYSNNNLIRRKVNQNAINHMSFKDIAIYNISPGCTYAFSSKIKDKLLETNYNLPHDLQIGIIGAVMNGLYYLDVVTTKYRIHSKNTIGLGHQKDYKKRVELCKKALCEKKEIKRLIQNITEAKEDDANIKYIDKIINVFELRNKLMQTRNIIKYAPKAMLYSIGLSRLYESVGLDIVSIILRKRRNV